MKSIEVTPIKPSKCWICLKKSKKIMCCQKIDNDDEGDVWMQSMKVTKRTFRKKFD